MRFTSKPAKEVARDINSGGILAAAQKKNFMTSHPKYAIYSIYGFRAA
jgi:hypothetical protein